jgi:hypothetical protein
MNSLSERDLVAVLVLVVLLWSIALGLFFTALTRFLFAYLLPQSQ